MKQRRPRSTARARHFAFETSIAESLLRQIRGEGPGRSVSSVIVVAPKWHRQPPFQYGIAFLGFKPSEVVMRVSTSRMEQPMRRIGCRPILENYRSRNRPQLTIEVLRWMTGIGNGHRYRGGRLLGWQRTSHYHGTKGPPPGTIADFSAPTTWESEQTRPDSSGPRLPPIAQLRCTTRHRSVETPVSNLRFLPRNSVKEAFRRVCLKEVPSLGANTTNRLSTQLDGRLL